jgi:hypothetical protein
MKGLPLKVCEQKACKEKCFAEKIKTLRISMGRAQNHIVKMFIYYPAPVV